MTDLKQLSVEHLNEAVKAYAENNGALRIAEITENQNEVLKLRFKSQSLESTVNYWRAIVEQEKANQWKL